jgi:hypothetical protein
MREGKKHWIAQWKQETNKHGKREIICSKKMKEIEEFPKTTTCIQILRYINYNHGTGYICNKMHT